MKTQRRSQAIADQKEAKKRLVDDILKYVRTTGVNISEEAGLNKTEWHSVGNRSIEIYSFFSLTA